MATSCTLLVVTAAFAIASDIIDDAGISSVPVNSALFIVALVAASNLPRASVSKDP